MLGPTKRALFMMSELSAIALGRFSLLSTMSSRKVPRLGLANALTVPRNSEIARICHTWIRPANVRSASSKACASASACVMSSSLRRL